nr:hypothetical protein [Tanacetum cinerariifolium]
MVATGIAIPNSNNNSNSSKVMMTSSRPPSPSIPKRPPLLPSEQNGPPLPRRPKSRDKVVSDCDNNSDRTVSDAESVSSGSIRGITPRAILVPPRFRQEPVNRLRKVQPEPVSPPLSRNSKLLSGNRYLRDGPTLSPRGNSPSPVRGAVRPASPARGAVRPASPVRGAVRPASPVKGAVRPASPNKSVPYSSALSPSRGMASPTRVRSGVGVTSNLGNAPSILNFAAETRRRKVGDNAVADAHLLRMLHNKYLQWRFANARADAAMLVQRSAAEKCLYNSWVTTSKMRQSVMSKQIEIQQLRQNLKLYTVLKNQTPYLKVWDQGERDHTVSLSGTILSLESSTLRLPLVDGSKADLPSLKDAMRSAADVMQTMVSSIRSSVSKVEHVNSLASELASTTANERSKLDQCKDLLSMLTHMEVAALMRLGMRCGWLLSSDIGFSGSCSLSIQFVPPTSVMTPYLKVWDQGERDHTVSLSGTILSLESSTLRLPLVDGSKADLPSLKDAMRSAADVMQTMVSSIRSSVSKVEHVNSLASELASTTANERSKLDQCKDLLSMLTHMEYGLDDFYPIKSLQS